MDEMKDPVYLDQISDFNHVVFLSLNTFKHGMESRVISQIKEEFMFKRGCYGSDLGGEKKNQTQIYT